MSASTPATGGPVEAKRRFKDITSPCEWVEDYRPGGYHPVHLGDVFHSGQYKVLRKLGEGSYSTVWLAHDLWNSRYVALKILVSSISASTSELHILRHLSDVAAADCAWHITQLLDDFEHRGPNGTHKCLVFEPMGPSVNAMVEELPQFKPKKFGMKIRYPPPMAKSILKQYLQALAFLHDKGIAHGDVQPGNMLFTLDDDMDSTPEDALRQADNVESVSPPVTRLDGLDGTLDKSAPRYLCIAQPLAPFTSYADGFKIKLSDLGGAYFFSDPPARPLTPLGLRAPELIVGGAVHPSLDIWSFGCLVFEFMTGRPLFCVPGCGGYVDDDHLLSLHAVLGALPDNLFEQWKTSSLYFTPERELFNCHLGGVPKGRGPVMLKQQSMEELFDEAGPDLPVEEALAVKSLVRRILQYDPAKRPSAAEILADSWFADASSSSK